MVQPPGGTTDHLLGGALALKPPWEQWFTVGTAFSIVSSADPQGTL